MLNVVCTKQSRRRGYYYCYSWDVSLLESFQQVNPIQFIPIAKRSYSKITTSSTRKPIGIGYGRIPSRWMDDPVRYYSKLHTTITSSVSSSNIVTTRWMMVQTTGSRSRYQNSMILRPFFQPRCYGDYTYTHLYHNNIIFSRNLCSNSRRTSILLPEIDTAVADYIQECIKSVRDSMMLETDEDIHNVINGIWKALKPIYGKNMKVSHIQSFGLDGIIELAKAVQIELVKAQKKNRTNNNQKQLSTKIRFDIPHHKTHYILDWKIGQSILDVAKNNIDLLGEYMEGTCNGTMSCSTCHIYIKDPMIQQLLIEPEESELDMLDLAYEVIEHTSRLGCQIKLSEELYQFSIQHGPITVTIPAGVNNVWHVNTWF
jgi:ferredoxin